MKSVIDQSESAEGENSSDLSPGCRKKTTKKRSIYDYVSILRNFFPTRWPKYDYFSLKAELLLKYWVEAWYKKQRWLYLLIPLSGVYRLIITLKEICYKIGLFRKTYFSIPVIVVGNLTVGGTGKTPLLIELAQYLSQQGYNAGIVARGYGGSEKHFPITVTAQSDPYKVGDEPVLIARRTNCPVVIDPCRPRAVKQLLKANFCDVVLSDDGLQHTALARDIEIVVIDGKRRFGNAHCLPAGPLREPLQRLKSIDFLVANQGFSEELPESKEWKMGLVPGEICKLIDVTRKLDPRLLKSPVHAVAGIGNPQRFFDYLRTLGLSVITHSFKDHHRYSPEDINFEEDSIVIMTEKDAVKCEKFADQRHWYLPIVSESELEFKHQLVKKLFLFSKNRKLNPALR